VDLSVLYTMEDDENLDVNEDIDEDDIDVELHEEEEGQFVRFLGAGGRAIQVPIGIFQMISGAVFGRGQHEDMLAPPRADRPAYVKSFEACCSRTFGTLLASASVLKPALWFCLVAPN